MNFDQFQSDYPVIADLLPQNFIADADGENTLRRAIKEDRTDYLSLLNTLAQESPAESFAYLGLLKSVSINPAS